jgi:hypothetical protein
MQDEKYLEQLNEQKKQIAQQILRDNIMIVSKCLYTFWQNHVHDIKHVLSSRGQKQKKPRNESTKFKIAE